MSDIFDCQTFALDARQAAIKGRRIAYAHGGIGLRVISVEQIPPLIRSRLVRGRYLPIGGHSYYQVWMTVAEWRINYSPSALLTYRFGVSARPTLRNGDRVRTLAMGLDYAGGSRHEMPPRSIGVIVGRPGPHLLVEFPALPRHRFRYAEGDLEPMPKVETKS